MFKGKFNHLIGIYIHSITYSNYPPRDIFIESIKSRNGFIFVLLIERRRKHERSLVQRQIQSEVYSLFEVIGRRIKTSEGSFVQRRLHSIESINSDSINRYPADWKKDKTRGIIFKIQSSNRGCSLFENIADIQSERNKFLGRRFPPTYLSGPSAVIHPVDPPVTRS